MGYSSTTSAHRLHEVLKGVRESGTNSIAAAWSYVLGAEWGSSECARRHAEVVSLLSDAAKDVSALPENSRVRSMRYFLEWWRMVVAPEVHWGDGRHTPEALVDINMLDHLESAAELIAAHMRGSSAAPDADNLEDLRSQAVEWLDILQETPDDEMPSGLKREIQSNVHHLIWLVDNAHLFGGARVAREANTLIGTLAQGTMQVQNSGAETAGRWKRGFYAFVAVAMMFTTGATVTQGALEAGSGLVQEIVSDSGSETAQK